MHAASREPYLPLSVEYLFYHARRRVPPIDPTRGASVPNITDALRSDGQPEEPAWPYLTSLPADVTTYCPPSSIGSPIYCAEAAATPLDAAALHASLTLGRPVVIVIWLTPAFFAPAVGGWIDDAPAALVGLHAVVVVGCIEHQGARAFRVKNSWGSGWGDGGYAWITSSYLRENGVAAVEMVV